MTVLFKTNPLHWEQNENSGYRNVQVLYKGNNILSIVANKTLGTWTTQAVPMGYSYQLDEINFLAELYKHIPYVMNYLISDDKLTHEDIVNFLENINVK